MAHEETVTIKKDTLWKIIAGVFALLFVVMLVNNLSGNNQAQPAQPQQGAQQQANPTVKIDVKTLSDDDPVLGNPNAKVTIIEFSDFQCPFCGRFFTDTLPQIKANYIDTGKVKLVFRDFPLTQIHENAEKGAEAADCARDQGGDATFWKMHDKIFSNQASLSVDNLRKWAGDLGLDTAKFNTCLDSGKFASEVQKDEQDGIAVGVQGTPSFVIDGQLIQGAQPYPAFQQALDAALAKA